MSCTPYHLAGMAKKIPFIFGSFNYDGLTHAQRVCRLYRACLQTVWSYEWRDMELQRRDMVRIRYLFDKNKDVSNIRFGRTDRGRQSNLFNSDQFNISHSFRGD